MNKIQRSIARGSARNLIALILVISAAAQNPAHSKELLFLAAASTTSIFSVLAKSYQNQHRGAKIILSFAASSTLARQVLNGVKADMFLSANKHWIDAVEKKQLIAKGTRTDLLGNSLVLLTSRHTDRIPGPASAANIHRLLKGRRLIIADPAHVPLGLYTKQSLEVIGWWKQLAPEFAFAPSSRALVNLVLRTGNPGIAYATDLRVSNQLRSLHRFSDHLHQPITYSLAILKSRQQPHVNKFFAYLKSPAAQTVYRQYGFRTLFHAVKE